MKLLFKRTPFLLISTLVFIFVSSVAKAQDIDFTQPYSNPLLINPAILGANGDIKIIFNYKSQFRNIDKGYSNSSFEVVYPLFLKQNNRKLDFGLNFQNNRAGVFNKQITLMSIGYDIKLQDSWHMSLSLIGGFSQKSIDFGLTKFDEQFVNSSNLLNKKINNQDIGFGVMWYYNPIRTDSLGKINAFIGMSGYHLNTPNESFLSGQSILPRKFSYQGGIKIMGKNKFDYSPNLRVNVQGDFEDILPGLYVDYRFNSLFKISGGVWLRKNGPNSFLLAIEHKHFSLGYSYDVYLSSSMSNYSNNVTSNSNQISLVYRYGLANKKGISMNSSPFSSF